MCTIPAAPFFNNDLTMNESTISQARRLFAAGCPDISLSLVSHHRITFEPIPLGRLWDMAHKLGLEYEFPLELTSNELTEALVAALEDYYRHENND